MQSVCIVYGTQCAATCCGKMYMMRLNQSLLEIASYCQLEPELWKFLYIVRKWGVDNLRYSIFDPIPVRYIICPFFTFPSSLLLFHSLKREIRGIGPGQILDFCFAVCGFLFLNVVTNSGSRNYFRAQCTRNNGTNFRALRCRLFNSCSHVQYLMQLSKWRFMVILCVRLFHRGVT